MLANPHGKERPRQVIPFSNQIFCEGSCFRGADIYFSPKIFEYFVRVKREHDFVFPALHLGEHIGKIAVRFLCHRPRTSPKTRNLLSDTEKPRRLPRFPGNAKPRKLLRALVIVLEGERHGIWLGKSHEIYRITWRLSLRRFVRQHAHPKGEARRPSSVRCS